MCRNFHHRKASTSIQLSTRHFPETPVYTLDCEEPQNPGRFTVTPAQDATHFRNIRAARANLAQAEADLREAVQQAREAGDSWTVIGAALETTRQAAYQRFGRD
ncbi:hypothetical protein QDX21_04690 [Auritidibacter ignavus]|uniref:Uncharacterized protein n=1 Tax=Auritidibacter ignavus TaxID=678932 RepID=A0AAJ6DDQ2_9MICC|nr:MULTISPECIES: hypothetical protein [Auritidibacter]WGH94092.1 hypothetical protein QDX21_04690 [Auritidibacter ignavus]WHS27613.1 hypothetical protein QM395_09555 [Auritidibacter ignavus]